VQRRLEHIGRNGKGKSTELTPELLDTSNSLELQEAPLAKLLTKARTGGEFVEGADLWSCLFGNSARQNRATGSDLLDREIARHLGAEAAEERRIEEAH
jgi:E3 ubiquitin-protein ligase SHPRH